MLKLTPILLIIVIALIQWRFSVWRIGRELDATSSPLNDPALGRVLGRLARAVGVESIPVHIHEIDVVNGLAAPDGRIFLTRGFYRRFQSGDITAEELAAVIAHEMGHVALGHARRRMIDFTGQNVIRVALLSTVGRIVPVIGPWIAAMVAGLVAARLSRQDEYEADEWASALLTKSGLGTAPQKSLFAKLERMAGPGRAAAPAWLLTHPASAERIAAIERNERRWGISPDGR